MFRQIASVIVAAKKPKGSVLTAKERAAHRRAFKGFLKMQSEGKIRDL